MPELGRGVFLVEPTQVARHNQRKQIPVVHADAEHVIAVPEAADHLFESKLVLRTAGKIPHLRTGSLAEGLGSPFQVATKSVFFGLYLIEDEARDTTVTPKINATINRKLRSA